MPGTSRYLPDIIAQTGAVISSAFQGAQDEMIRKFAAMLQMLGQMIKAAQQFSDALKIDSPLDVLGAVLSFFGGFAGIGSIFAEPMTGGGRGETTEAGFYRPPVVSLVTAGSSEIRALRRSMETLNFSPTIVFRNVLDAQKIVREEIAGGGEVERAQTGDVRWMARSRSYSNGTTERRWTYRITSRTTMRSR